MKHSVQQMRQKYAKVYRSLGRGVLQKGKSDDLGLDLQDLFLPHIDSELWLDFYTKEGLWQALLEYNFVAELEKRGYQEFNPTLHLNEMGEHMLRVFSTKPAFSTPLVEMVVRRTYLQLPDDIRPHVEDSHQQILSLEWLQMQHPLASFHQERLPLPGQQIRGLGLSHEVAELIRNSCKRLSLVGALSVPSYFHNAIFYSERFYYIDPVMQGTMEALQRDLFAQLLQMYPSWSKSKLLAASSWAIVWGLVKQEPDLSEEASFKWEHTSMLSPVHQTWRRYFKSDWYNDTVQHTIDTHHYSLMTSLLSSKLEQSGLHPFDLSKINEWLDPTPKEEE